MKLIFSFLLTVFLLAPFLQAAETAELIKQLGSENESERAAALMELRKIGQPAEAALRAALKDGPPRQEFLARRLLGEMLLAHSNLRPLDLSALAPLGEEKAAGKAGNPFILVDSDKKIIVLDGSFILERGLLECLVVSRVPNARTWETVVSVRALPRDICMALLKCNYTFADEITDDNRVKLPKEAGVMVSVEFLWEEPRADMEPAPSLVSVCKAILQKHNLLAEGKASGRRRELLQFDLDGDVALLRDLLGSLPEADPAASKILISMQESLANENLSGDENARAALAPLLAQYLKLKDVSLQAAPPPEKKLIRIPIEFCAWNTATERTMKRVPFAFTGSVFEKNSETGRQVLAADYEGTVIALRWEKVALLNTILDTRNVNPYRDAGYVVNQQIVPWRRTRCRLVFEPWTEGNLSLEELKDMEEPKSGK